MKEGSKQIVPNWVLFCAAGFAFVAIADIPYGYYRLLRWIVCSVSIASAIQLHKTRRIGWVWTLAGLAILFNPLIPLHFERETWRVFDATAGAIFLAVFYVTLREKHGQKDDLA